MFMGADGDYSDGAEAEETLPAPPRVRAKPVAGESVFMQLAKSEKYGEALVQAAVAGGLDAKRARAVLLTIAVERGQEMNGAKPGSLLRALLALLRSGLIPDGKEAAIFVGSQGKVDTRIMVSGLAKICRMQGLLGEGPLMSGVVYMDDDFEHSESSDGTKFRHSPSLDRLGDAKADGDLTDVRAVWARLPLPSGAFASHVISRAQIERRRAEAYDGGRKGPWQSWTLEMAGKTALLTALRALRPSMNVAGALGD